MLVYNPGTSNGTATTTYSVDMSALTAAPTAIARWWNSGTGAYTNVGTYSTTGTQLRRAAALRTRSANQRRQQQGSTNEVTPRQHGSPFRRD